MLQLFPEAFTYKYSTARTDTRLLHLWAFLLPPYKNSTARMDREPLPIPASTYDAAFLTSDSIHYYLTSLRYSLTDTWIYPKNNEHVYVIWQTESGHWKKTDLGYHDLAKMSNIHSFYALDDRFLLIIKNLHEYFVLDKKRDELHPFDLHSLGIRPAVHIAATIFDDHFWISTDDGAAAFSFDGALREIVRLAEIRNNNLLLRTHKDRSGNIWTGTQEGGLFLIPAAHLRTRKLLLPQYKNAHFEQLIPWEDGRIIGITAPNSGVYEITAQGIKELVPPDPKQRFRKAFKVGNELWVSCNTDAFKLRFHNGHWQQSPLQLANQYDKDVLLYKNNKSQLDKNRNIPWPINVASAAYSSSRQAFWGLVGGMYLYKYDLAQQRATYINEDIANSQCISYDPTRQVLLAGRWDGILQWDEQQTTPFLASYDELKNISALYSTPGQLWIGTEGNGLFCYRYAADSLQRVSDFSVVRQIRPGAEGTVLVAGASGVLVVDGSTGQIRHHFNQLDGLPGNDTQDVAPWNERTILVATSQGVYSVDLKHPQLPSLAKEALRITRFSVNDTVLDTNIWHQPLSHHQNNISFSFHLQHIASRGQIVYKTRLEPLETVWQTQQDRSIQYPGLRPGDYTFHLEATDIYGRTVTLAPFPFTIRPAWWQTLWFKALVWLLAVGGLAGIARRRRKKERIELQKEKALNKRLAQLELSALRAQMNPHFVFNALGAIQYYIQTNEVDTADSYLTMFATLMRKYLESSREQVISLEQEVQLLEYYTQLEMMRFEGIFQTSITVSSSLQQYNAHLPSMLVQPFVENAINHGLCERRDGQGQLRIYFEGDEDNIKCTIEDNGIGREKSRLRRSKAHRSQAMRIVEEKIETLKLSDTAAITVYITDAQLEHTEYPGTKVVLHIKNLDNEEH